MDADEYRQLIANIDEELGDLYRQRRRWQEEFSREHPVLLPEPKLRTPLQQKVARCPRCGTRFGDVA